MKTGAGLCRTCSTIKSVPCLAAVSRLNDMFPQSGCHWMLVSAGREVLLPCCSHTMEVSGKQMFTNINFACVTLSLKRQCSSVLCACVTGCLSRHSFHVNVLLHFDEAERTPGVTFN